MASRKPSLSSTQKAAKLAAALNESNDTSDDDPSPKVVSLSALLSKKATYIYFKTWFVGDTPLITNAWSKKAKDQMLQKQLKATRPGKDIRDPKGDFVDSLYEMGDGSYGFPAMGVKNCILSAAHKDKGIARSAVQQALWLDADLVRVRPALEGAICDMPLIRIYGTEPEMREDMVKIGAGLNKVANLAYRGQFRSWAILVSGKFNTAVLSTESLTFLINDAGIAAGLGEWRNERKGMFGAFHLASVAEEKAWYAYRDGGPLPVVAEQFREAAE
jgi:hypothetical protein